MFHTNYKPILWTCVRLGTSNSIRTWIQSQLQFQSRCFFTGFATKLCANVSDFNAAKVVLVKKITRYEYEKQLKPEFNEAKLKEHLTAKGSDYNGLVDRHDEYYKVLEQVHEHLVARGVQVEVARRFDYDTKMINWADAVITVGGDGTFLMAASKVKGHDKPVIGINADPLRSEGQLCLPKKWSLNFKESIDRFLERKFKWMWRQRIRLMLSGKCGQLVPVDLHDQQMLWPEHRFLEHVRENEQHQSRCSDQRDREACILPVLALNDVFIGESLSSRVSFYEIGIGGSPRVKQKSSGITISTGTGSTSWFFNINHVPEQSIQQILEITNKYCGSNVSTDDMALMEEISKTFNSSLIFAPDHLSMAYVVRDPVAKGIYHVESSRGFCEKISIKSRMWDASVVIDGSISYNFNDGSIVDLKVLDEDALRCVKL